ncbi:MAG: hypothetical protein DCC65_08640 [Planctomycetota bacterium]|nr:MAG: hypothetical protein DCC65_08640 [Planctomycetota bacterium]
MRCPRAARPAAALLEVVIAISILLVAMAVVGATFQNGARNVELAERMNQAGALTDRLLAELDLGLLTMTEGEANGPPQEFSGYFGEDAPPGLAWKAEVSRDPSLPGMLKVGVHIIAGDPEATDGRQQRILSTYVWRAEPRNINLETDFGFSQEQLDMLTDAIPGGAAVLDPTNFNPRDIASLPLDQLQQLLPLIMQALGGGMIGGQLDSLLQAAQSGDLSGLQDLARQLGQQGGAVPGLPGLPDMGGRQPGRVGVQPPGGQQGQPGQRGGGRK